MPWANIRCESPVAAQLHLLPGDASAWLHSTFGGWFVRHRESTESMNSTTRRPGIPLHGGVHENPIDTILSPGTPLQDRLA